MEILQAIILGLVQGLGEFLPISSSGHLVIIPRIFNWPDQGLGFDVALHLGTLMSLLLFFYKDWVKIISDSYFIKQSSKIIIDREREFFTWKKLKNDILFIIILATIPGVISGLFLENYAETIFRNPLLVSFTLFGGAVLLFASDKMGKKNIEEVGGVDLKKGLLIGLFQALAIFPGVSRSGITITTALFLGLDRRLSARFSFLLATPIVMGASFREIPKLLGGGIDINLIVGVLVAFVSGYMAIKYMLKFLENRDYNVFVIYRMALALAVFVAFI